MILNTLQPKSDKEICESLDKLQPDDILAKSCRFGYLIGVIQALNKGVDPSAMYNYAIQIASFYGYIEIINFLLKDSRVDPSANKNHAIRWASSNGHKEAVELLLEDSRVDPSAMNNYAIKSAHVNGYIDVVQILSKDRRVKL